MLLSHDVLTDPAYDVPGVPDAPAGVAWLRASVPRFSTGATHERRRALAVAELAKLDDVASAIIGNLLWWTAALKEARDKI